MSNFTIVPSFRDFERLLEKNDYRFHTTFKMPESHRRALGYAENREYILDDGEILYRWWRDGWIEFDLEGETNA